MLNLFSLFFIILCASIYTFELGSVVNVFKSDQFRILSHVKYVPQNKTYPLNAKFNNIMYYSTFEFTKIYTAMVSGVKNVL